MRGLFILAAAILSASGAFAGDVLAARTLPARTIIAASDLRSDAQDAALLSSLVGLETRVTIYSGRPVRAGDVGAPALVDRNQVVELVFYRGGLRITTEARALGRGAAGERIRVMNLASRTALFGRIRADGRVDVSP